MYDISDEILDERYRLAIDRIRQVREEENAREPYRDYFRQVAAFILLMDEVRQALLTGEERNRSFSERMAVNHRMYEDILPGHYESSYANPQFAAEKLGLQFKLQINDTVVL